MHLLNLALDLVIIRSLVGIMRSPFTIVWATRGSLSVKSLERAITLANRISNEISINLGNLLLSDLVVADKADRVLKPFAEDNL